MSGAAAHVTLEVLRAAAQVGQRGGVGQGAGHLIDNLQIKKSFLQPILKVGLRMTRDLVSSCCQTDLYAVGLGEDEWSTHSRSSLLEGDEQPYRPHGKSS